MFVSPVVFIFVLFLNPNRASYEYFGRDKKARSGQPAGIRKEVPELNEELCATPLYYYQLHL
jgi:hypothetical protein